MFTFLVTLLLSTKAAHACIHDLATRGLIGFTPEPINIRPRVAPCPQAAQSSIAIQNVTMFDGSQIGKPSTVVISGGKISSIVSKANAPPPPGGTIVNGNGGVLLPGLIDSHVHPQSMAALGNLSSYGVTTALGMACQPEPTCNLLRNQTGLTDFLSAGVAAASPGSEHALFLQYPPDVLIYSPSDAPQWVANRIGNESNYIKLIAESGGMTQDEHNAIVSQAHSSGKQSTTHAASYASMNQAIISGTNAIQHIPPDQAITPAMLAAMLQLHQTVTPTLTIMRIIEGSVIASPGSSYAMAVSNAHAVYAAGIPILVGTDSYDGTAATGLYAPYGLAVHQELQNLVYDVGLSTVQALQAATSGPAHYWGLVDRGAIKVGLRADLLLVSGNPITNISNTLNIVKVWNAGIEFTPVA